MNSACRTLPLLVLLGACGSDHVVLTYYDPPGSTLHRKEVVLEHGFLVDDIVVLTDLATLCEQGATSGWAADNVFLSFEYGEADQLEVYEWEVTTWVGIMPRCGVTRGASEVPITMRGSPMTSIEGELDVEFDEGGGARGSFVASRCDEDVPLGQACP